MLKRVSKYNFDPDGIQMHVLVEMIVRGRKYFNGKLYETSDLNMHIPLPVQEALMHSLGGFGVKNRHGTWYILGIKCVSAYENRIVITHPTYAIYDNEPKVVIELEIKNGQCYPAYYELNEHD